MPVINARMHAIAFDTDIGSYIYELTDIGILLVSPRHHCLYIAVLTYLYLVFQRTRL